MSDAVRAGRGDRGVVEQAALAWLESVVGPTRCRDRVASRVPSLSTIFADQFLYVN
jgi:hypothetical protein